MSEKAESVDLEKSHVVVLDAAGAADVKGAGASQQPEDEFDQWTPGGSIQPPEDLSQLIRLTGVNGTRRGIIEAISLNTVGLGHNLEIREGHEHDLPEHQGQEIISVLDGLAERDWRLGNPGLSELLMAVKHDEEGCGNGYIEISRNKLTGQIDGLYHLPGHLMRRRKDRRGWIMGRKMDLSSERQLFYNFGDKVQYDDQGKALGKLRPGRNWKTNEVTPFRIYTSESRDYGLPRDIGLAVDYAGDKMAADANLSFFDSHGVPASILFVQGTETEQGGRVTFKVPQKTVDRIGATMRSNPGGGSRVAIVPVPAGTEANLVQLGQFSERDMAFTEYRKDNRGRQLAAFRVSPIFLSISAEGQYSAEVERSITLEQVFDPEQRRYERRLNRILIDLGYHPYEFKFKRLAVEGDAAVSENAEMLAEAGNITVGEHRKAHGFAPYREARKGELPDEDSGEKPFGFNSRLLLDLGEDEAESIEPPVPKERTPASEDQRGERPGVGGRRRKRPPAKDQATVAERNSRQAMKKHGVDPDDLPEYVELEIEELQSELAAGLSENGNGNGNGT